MGLAITLRVNAVTICVCRSGSLGDASGPCRLCRRGLIFAERDDIELCVVHHSPFLHMPASAHAVNIRQTDHHYHCGQARSHIRAHLRP